MHAFNAGTAHELLPFLSGCTQLHKHVRMGTVTGLDVHELYSHLLHLHRLLHLHSMSTPTATEAKISCLGPPQHRSWDPQGLRGGDRTPTTPHSPRGDAIYPKTRAVSPGTTWQEGHPFSPTPPCVPQLLLVGGCTPPDPLHLRIPSPPSGGLGAAPPFTCGSEEPPAALGRIKEGKKGEKRGKKKEARSLRAP